MRRVIIVAAAPGSGKTQGLMIPNCLNWPGSLVALDIKGECYDRTAGFRAAMGQAVYKIEFLSRDYRTHQYNPFGYVSEDKNFRVGDIERIAHYLLPNPPGPGGDPFWATSARDMFRAIALYLFETAGSCTLGGVLDVADTPEELQKFARRVVREAAAGTLSVDAQTVRDFATIANRPDKTHGGVKDNLTGALAPLKNPLVRYATDGNTFDLRDLRSERMSVYMTVKKPDLPPLRPIINLFFQQLVDLSSMIEYGKDPSHRHEVLLGMDEFAQLGRLDAVFEGVTFFRSFGLRLLAILQSPSQLRTNYSIEGAKTFEQSFDCSVFYTPSPRDIETAELISKLLGNNTVKGRSESKRKGFETKYDSTSTSDQERALMLPQEVMRMPGTKQIIVISGLGADLRQQGASVGRAHSPHASGRAAHPAEGPGRRCLGASGRCLLVASHRIRAMDRARRRRRIAVDGSRGLRDRLQPHRVPETGVERGRDRSPGQRVRGNGDW